MIHRDPEKAGISQPRGIRPEASQEVVEYFKMGYRKNTLGLWELRKFLVQLTHVMEKPLLNRGTRLENIRILESVINIVDILNPPPIHETTLKQFLRPGPIADMHVTKQGLGTNISLVMQFLRQHSGRTLGA